MEGYTGDVDSEEYSKLLKIQERLLNKCGVPILKMILGLASNPKFNGYTWKDEMIADAEIKCVKALVGRKFKPNIEKDGKIIKYNPFSYFNRIAWREFLHRNRVEKDHVETRRKYIDEHALDYAEGQGGKIRVKRQFQISSDDLWNEENDVLHDDE